MTSPTEQQEIFLSIMPAGRLKRQIALGVVLACLAISLATAPFARAL